MLLVSADILRPCSSALICKTQEGEQGKQHQAGITGCLLSVFRRAQAGSARAERSVRKRTQQWEQGGR